ncbi:MAG: 3-phosphoshikimate 1-carboxyvinyltransferase [Magnetococcales bacterium]|nr:3-phosphoshikimate 1-carboxyvinyltransferase [Magnetococcales bacterium]
MVATNSAASRDGLVLQAQAGSPLSGTIQPPGDKSISHRSIIFGSLAEGETRVENLLEGEDVLRTVAAFEAMGVAIERTGEGRYLIDGVGLDGLSEPDNVLDVGNSGTAMRLLAGVLANRPFMTILTGDDSLRYRPMGRIAKPLRSMGARILGRDGGRFAPLVIEGTELIPIDYISPVASAQVKTAVLLAGLNTAGETSVTEPALTRDHTERMLSAFGAEVKREGLKVTVEGWPDLKGQSIRVPGDFSAAAFPIVAALVVPGSDILLEGVGFNPTRTGLLDLLLAMGGDIERLNEREVGGEPVVDLRVRYSKLSGITVPPQTVPRAIDEFPIFFTAAALAHGETVLSGAEELRVKESDRIAAMAKGLLELGARVEELPDGARIMGAGGTLPGGVRVDSHTDHRIAMSLLIAGLCCHKPVTVTRCDNINTSFPGFATAMTGLGANLVVEGPG